jgi:hypothetical protein
MADDLQRQALMFQLNQAGKISDTTLLSYADLKVEDEADLQITESGFRAEAIRKQQLLQAEVQAEAQTVLAKAQAKAQAAMAQATAAAQTPQQDPFAAAQSSQLTQPPGVPLDAAAAALAQEVRKMPAERQKAYLTQLQVQMPEAVQLLQQQGMPDLPGMPSVGNAGAPQPPPNQGGVDMRPQPDVLPPRRT